MDRVSILLLNGHKPVKRRVSIGFERFRPERGFAVKDYTFEVVMKSVITVQANDEHEALKIASNEFLTEDPISVDIKLLT